MMANARVHAAVFAACVGKCLGEPLAVCCGLAEFGERGGGTGE
jgi:hypothetical protein